MIFILPLSKQSIMQPTHWESKINRFFLSHKNQLDRISCYYMRIEGKDLAKEIYHRINNDGQDFSQLGLQYGIGIKI